MKRDEIIESVRKFAEMAQRGSIIYEQVRPMAPREVHLIKHTGPHIWEDALYTGDCSGFFVANRLRYQRCACGASRFTDQWGIEVSWDSFTQT